MDSLSYASESAALSRAKNRRILLLLALCFIGLLVAGTIVWLYVRSSSPNLGMLREGARSSFKLVVASTSHAVSINRESKSDTYWEKIKKFVSSSTIKVRVHGCQAQWAIQLDALADDDLFYEDQTLVVRVPRPAVDETMVDVPSDPASWQIDRGDGWLRWDGNILESELRAAIRKSVVEGAKQAGLDPAFETQAKLKMKEHVEKLLRAQGDKVPPVEIRFR